jgi:hypothetical protein
MIRRRVASERRGWRLGSALVGALALGAAPAAGAEPPPEPEPQDAAATAPVDPGDWQLSLGLYGWVTDMTGTLSARDTTADVDPQLWNDILKNLNGALMGAAEVSYRGRWLLNVDLFGSLLETESERGPFSAGFGPRSFSRELRGGSTVYPVETRLGTLEVPIRLDPGTLRVDVPRVEATIGPYDVDVKSLMVYARALVGYRLFDVPALELLGEDPGEDRRRVRVDLFGGLRYWYLKNEIDVESPPIEVPEFAVTSSLSGGRVRVGGQRIPPQSVAFRTVRLPGLEFGPAAFGGADIDESTSSWWVDPVIGLRVGADVTDRVGVVVAANVGGFDIGSASKLSWEALAVLDWRFGKTTSFILGYRGLGLDRRKGKAQADVILHGPLLGLIFRY